MVTQDAPWGSPPRPLTAGLQPGPRLLSSGCSMPTVTNHQILSLGEVTADLGGAGGSGQKGTLTEDHWRELQDGSRVTLVLSKALNSILPALWPSSSSLWNLEASG